MGEKEMETRKLAEGADLTKVYTQEEADADLATLDAYYFGDLTEYPGEAARRFYGYGCAVGTGWWNRLPTPAVPVAEDKGDVGTGAGGENGGVLSGPDDAGGVLEIERN